MVFVFSNMKNIKCRSRSGGEVTGDLERSRDDQWQRQKQLVIRIAALFGGPFSLDWLEEITGLKASVILSVLEEQVRQQVLLRVKPAVYQFRDDKRRDKQAQRLTDTEREKYHRGIAEVLIRELLDDDMKAIEVSRHLLAVSNNPIGCEWLIRAGKAYVDSFSAENAIVCFEKVLNDLAGKRGIDADRLFVAAAIAHSGTSLSRSSIQTSMARLQEARERAAGLNDHACSIILEMHIAKHERVLSGINQALSHFEKAFSQVRALNDPTLTAATSTFSTYFLFWQGRFREVVEVYERSTPDVEKHPTSYLSIIATMMVGHSYVLAGRLTEGLGLLDSIRDHCRRKGDRYLSSYAGSVIGMIMLFINRNEDASRCLKQALREGRQSHNRPVERVAVLLLTAIKFKQGGANRPIGVLRGFLSERGETPIHSLLPRYLVDILWTMTSDGLSPVLEFSLDAEIAKLVESRNVYLQGVGYRYWALQAKAKGHPNGELVRAFKLSLKRLKESGCAIDQAFTYLDMARHYLAVKNPGLGKRAARSAFEIFSSTALTELMPDDLKSLIGNETLPKNTVDEIARLTSFMTESRKADVGAFQHIVTTGNRLTGAERGMMLLLGTERTSTPELRASKNLTMEQINCQDFALARLWIEEVASSGKGRIFDPAPGSDEEPITGGTIHSGVCVPIVMDHATVGVLYHDNRLIGNVFKPSDLKFLTLLASLAAIQLKYDKAGKEVDRLRRSLYPAERPTPADWQRVPQTEGMVGNSPEIRRVLTQIDEVAKTDATVLLLGQTGVGKTLAAQEIHNRSLRRDGPFVTVHCSALTESLITSELFGHEKGAFTGATNRQIGRFELADGGTLFLDEIGDLSLDVQARLLRVLQSKEFERVGGGKEVITSDFRLIAATNRSLEEEIEAKRFRGDLFYRINVFPLHIPDLSERKEDIPTLALHFDAIHSAEQGRPPLRISQEVMDELIAYDWPGNIRQLDNVIHRAVISSRGIFLRLPPLKGMEPVKERRDRFETLKENERRHILEALGRCKWKVHGPGGAAELLAINAFTLTARMRKLGITKPTTRP
jgi:transcriptional regulator with GAF, ATPase, and Fis domain/tetratricopeptide (TPR) repeat protein